MSFSETGLRRALWGLLVLVMAGVGGAAVWSLARAPVPSAQALPVYGRVPDFLLVGEGGPVAARDLRDRVWVASFIYTRCTDTCPAQTAEMAQLQAEFRDAPDFRLVSITVDPLHDTPPVLAAYARRFGADSGRWAFLTGERGAILALARDGFRLAVGEAPAGGEASPLARAFPEGPGAQGRSGAAAQSLAGGEQVRGGPRGPILHSARLALVDRAGRIRGTYESGEAAALGGLRRDIRALLREPAAGLPPAVPRSPLPALNATLNGASALLLVAGFLCIRRRRARAHKACMASACCTSALFLASYLTYHFQVGSVRFGGRGWVRPVYFAILLSHTLLAAAVVPLALATLGRALLGRFERHVRIARWTLPVWLYVSVTGVVVYWMLYHLYPPT